LKILAIEGDDEITRDISLALAKQWPEVRLVAAHMGNNGLELVRRESPDMILVDLGLPDIHGLEVIKQICLLSKAPILVLAVRGGEDDIDRALEYGASEYLIKPFRQEELMARLNALIGGGDAY